MHLYSPHDEAKRRSPGDGFGDVLILHGGAVVEEAAGGEELGTLRFSRREAVPLPVAGGCLCTAIPRAANSKCFLVYPWLEELS